MDEKYFLQKKKNFLVILRSFQEFKVNNLMADLEELHPLDALDPCCQREIENNRQQARVTAELRTYDITLKR